MTKQNKIQNTLDVIEDINPEAVLLDGLETAIIGITRNGVVAYSISGIIDILMTKKHGNMSYNTAREFFDYNIGCLGAGEFTPIFIEEI